MSNKPGNEISQYVGNQIKLYRKNKKMTQEQLALRINKSKATLSKYESGVIVVDVETLHDIAQALQISAGNLLGGAAPVPKYSGNSERLSSLYVYFLDDRGTKVRQSFMEITESAQGPIATMYCDAEANDKSKSTIIYIGEILITETVISFHLISTTNHLDQLYFTSLRPFLNQAPFIVGMCLGLNFAPICPVCFKAVLTYQKSYDENLNLELLQLNPLELKAFRKTSRYCLESFPL